MFVRKKKYLELQQQKDNLLELNSKLLAQVESTQELNTQLLAELKDTHEMNKKLLKMMTDAIKEAKRKRAEAQVNDND